MKLDGWSKRRSCRTAKGYYQYFYCNKDRINCNMSCFLFYDDTNSEVEFHVVENTEHNHTSEGKVQKFDKIKNTVQEILESGITKPKQVMRKLNKEFDIAFGVACLSGFCVVTENAKYDLTEIGKERKK